VDERIGHPLDLEALRPANAARRSDDRIARADDEIWISVDRPRAVAQLAREAVVQAGELRLLRVGEVEVGGEDAPVGVREAVVAADLDPAPPAHETRREPPRNAIGHEEVQVLVEEDARERGEAGSDRHPGLVDSCISGGTPLGSTTTLGELDS